LDTIVSKSKTTKLHQNIVNFTGFKFDFGAIFSLFWSPLSFINNNQRLYLQMFSKWLTRTHDDAFKSFIVLGFRSALPKTLGISLQLVLMKYTLF
jgi:hypothetical protein